MSLELASMTIAEIESCHNDLLEKIVSYVDGVLRLNSDEVDAILNAIDTISAMIKK